MSATPLKPSHKAIAAYYEGLKAYAGQQVEHEGALETAFSRLLADTAKPHGWTLIPKLSLKVGSKSIAPDGTLRDEFYLRHGYWEAKDTQDKLDAEIKKKIAKGYPLTNTIFEDTQHAILFQNGQERNRFDLTDAQQLADLLNEFFAHVEPEYDRFDQAVQEFKERVPELAQGLTDKIRKAHEDNGKFQSAFDKFFDLCQKTLNPNIRRDAVDEMLVQHLLTERLFRTIFDAADFTHRNVIAAEVEAVIGALTSQSFSRAEFLKSLDRFYKAIEGAAATLTEFSEKQHFLNTVYERFFQGYSVKTADTHGIVYTPQEIVDFMCASVAEVLDKEFGLTLGSPDVNILDPCTGTGNFIVNILRRIPKKDLPRMYAKQLFANEVMLLPYYIAALNIEHAYYELTGKYEPFEGLCFVDTLDMAEEKNSFVYMSEKNAERVDREKRAPITVVVGNPPYNAWQLDENDNNKNRKYKAVERRIRDTYTKDTAASNKNALSDAYVKFFRWASDRVATDAGIVCFVSNNGFIEGVAFDGFRKHLTQGFSTIYHLDLKGNARTSGERRRREGGNVFSDQIRVGIGITILVKQAVRDSCEILYHVVDDYGTANEKKRYLKASAQLSGVPWQQLHPDDRNNWFPAACAAAFAEFIPLGSKGAKAAGNSAPEAVFKLYGRGVATCRDEVVYDFQRNVLTGRVRKFIEDYNAEVDRYKRRLVAKGENKEGTVDKKQERSELDDFVRYERVKWSESLKANVMRHRYAQYDEADVRVSIYRPFSRRFLYYDGVLNDCTFRDFLASDCPVITRRSP